MAKQEAGGKRKRKCVTLTRVQVGLLVGGILVTVVVVGVSSGLLRSCPCSSQSPEPEMPMTGNVMAPHAVVSRDESGPEVPTLYKTGSAGKNDDDGEPEGIWQHLRLPSNLVPVHYDLVLFPDFYDGRATFYGNVSITIRVTSSPPVDCVLVHIKSLDILRTEVRLRKDGEQEQELVVRKNFSYPRNEFWVIQLEKKVDPGAVILVKIRFQGPLDNGIYGFYRSSYVDSRTGQKRYLATSKFQPTYARRAFPCFDEPGLKSNFSVTLIYRPGFTALSNMPAEVSSNYSGGLLATRFQTSVPMVTYLACFIVCDFKYKESRTTNGIPLRVFAPPDKIDQVDYALNISGRILELYEETFGLPYPLPKLDQIAIPDFASGAMEHWGLVTYRESSLLYDPLEASVFNKQRVAVVVAHELAHMWFGNLVTMDWWNDLWLNEGFASYVEYMGVNHVHPEWNMYSQFLTDAVQPVMTVDATASSHPIVVSVDRPDQISEVFDSISYNKGAAVLAMLESLTGKENFRKGLQLYMKKYQFKTAVTKDLWNCLSQVKGSPNISDVMASWTEQMGFPVVRVDIDLSFDPICLTLTQERFLVDPKANKSEPPSKFNYLWNIPLRVIDSNGEGQLISLQKKQDNFELRIRGYKQQETSWFKLNANGSSYLRVLYPESHWKRLAQLLKDKPQGLSASDRSNLLDDAFSLARANLISYRIPLELVKYIDQEKDYAPWRTFESHSVYIREMLQYDEHFGKWKRFLGDLLRPVLERVGYGGGGGEGGTHIERMVRTSVVGMACGVGIKECLDNVTSLLKRWLYNGEYIIPSLRGSVYRYGMQTAGFESEWNKMWKLYSNSTVPQEKTRLLLGLAQAREAWLLNRLLVYAMDEKKIRGQDFFTAISYMTSNPLGRALVWDWARNNWPKLVNRFSLNSRYLGRMIPGITHFFSTTFQLEEVESFFARYPDAGAGERGRKVALDVIRANIAWTNSSVKDIVDWLETNGYTADT